MRLGLVSELALEGALAGIVGHQFKDVGDVVTGALDTGVKALEFVAKKQDDFEVIKKAVQSLVGKKKPEAVASK